MLGTLTRSTVARCTFTMCALQCNTHADVTAACAQLQGFRATTIHPAYVQNNPNLTPGLGGPSLALRCFIISHCTKRLALGHEGKGLHPEVATHIPKLNSPNITLVLGTETIL